jgi:hypothetical protein
MTKIPLAEQIAEIEQLIGRTGEGVKTGALMPDMASARLLRLFAVLQTLRWLEKHEARIRAIVEGKRDDRTRNQPPDVTG